MATKKKTIKKKAPAKKKPAKKKVAPKAKTVKKKAAAKKTVKKNTPKKKVVQKVAPKITKPKIKKEPVVKAPPVLVPKELEAETKDFLDDEEEELEAYDDNNPAGEKDPVSEEDEDEFEEPNYGWGQVAVLDEPKEETPYYDEDEEYLKEGDDEEDAD